MLIALLRLTKSLLRMQGVGQRLMTLEAVRLPALEAKVADTSTADLLESLRSCARHF